jgi:hypothetical protein
MVRKVLFLSLAIVALAAVGAFAQIPPLNDYDTGYKGDLLPDGSTPPGTYELRDGAWIPAVYAIAWNSGGADSDGISNKPVFTFEITNHVSVAQWINWSISGTRKDWRVLRPGTYASDSVTARIQSNNDVVIEFYAEDPEYLSDGGVTRTIPKWFGYSETDQIDEVDNRGWWRGSDFSSDNPLVIRVRDSAGLHSGLTYKIWEKIEVLPSHSSSDYEGKGYVTIYLTNVKHWVDPDTGDFYEGGRSPYDPEV